ncbi:MAG: DinB family protein [Acidimicrobiales bacterium]
MRIVAFAEGGYAAQERGKFDTDDMFAVTARAGRFTDVDDICSYIARVRDDIATFLRRGSAESHERVVRSHYGGEVAEVELLRIMLRHSTHHLRQLHWFMEHVLLVPSTAPAPEDLAGIVTPDELFEVR